MQFIFDDGGREAAGFRGPARDCAVRAVAIAAQISYREVYDSINRLAGKPVARTGVPKKLTRKYLASLGWTWVPTMRIGSGCRVHLDERELPKGRIIVAVSSHLVAVVDGVVHDTYDPTREGSRCVYGYFRRGSV